MTRRGAIFDPNEDELSKRENKQNPTSIVDSFGLTSTTSIGLMISVNLQATKKDRKTMSAMIPRSLLIFLTLIVPLTHGFSSALFKEAPVHQHNAPSVIEGVEIELPDFDELFDRIQQISPLARSVISGAERPGFAGIDDACEFSSEELVPMARPVFLTRLHLSTATENMKWKTAEKNKRRTVHQIDKIDNFNGIPAPILRFRSSLKGPCIGECFAKYIMDLDERKKWDAQIEQVYEIHPIRDLDYANIAMGFGRFGDCSRLGVGYCQTKANLGISPREQLILCGIQDFRDGSCVIWGTEMEDWHNHMLPPGERHTRSKSHIFSTTMTPTGENTFDVEYVLQLEVGGNLPTWLTTPIIIDTVKKLFRTAESFFSGEDGELDEYLTEKMKKDELADRYSLLMTP